MKVVGIIPARYESVRFPGKPLADIQGKPMIQHVYERCCRVPLFERVIVATDDLRIQEAVSGFGGEVCMTLKTHRTGTDRLAEAARDLDAEIIVNVQGDEPLIQPEMIELAVQALLDDPDVVIGTLKHKIRTPEGLFNPNVVKVICDVNDRAVYFSRSPIPHIKGRDMRGEGFGGFEFYRHIGLYAYRRTFLLKFVDFAQTPLEIAEGLEQLRAMEYGYRIKVLETAGEIIGIDTPEDLERLRQLLNSREDGMGKTGCG
ncbi:3-deoxy-manno-octulosonate cytidylyltransferase [candidate division KSB3 bacterium]|uniref:3-deoxy-manno-octulosonate cytidylyltransferase n=1 Tax=candidate division KSB3 bacterium TaxID=2044937 RepID=A0A2G6EEQ4_9BACT|nr:MAG: 3-deoxy-manno-octulosonate cytidylyltransferase [candidate division KSB3 bacterium]PIE31074.1 MAG: 3-deoxy-manno-octulosonate cytidylyltransferase [candidate division KSB3 bacterium]